MAKVLIGHQGEQLHSFELDDVINRNAVQESGLFPELFKSAWPQHTSGILVSGQEHKLKEHRVAATYGQYDFPIYLPPSVFPVALEDSKEEEDLHEDIAEGKLFKSFLHPLTKTFERATEKQVERLKSRIARRASAVDIQHLVAIADDRNLIADHTFLEPVYGHMQDHWNPEVRQIFMSDNIPDVRVKETDGANYGVANSIYRYNIAAKLLEEQGIEFDRQFRMDTVLCIQNVLPGILPLPEQGIIVKSIGLPFERGEVTPEHIQKINQGRILSYEHFAQVKYKGVPKGITVDDLRKTHPNHKYFAIDYSPGAAMSAFLAAVKVPRNGDVKKARSFYMSRYKPKTVVTSSMLMTQRPSQEDIIATVDLPSKMKLSKYNSTSGQNDGIKSLRKLERHVCSGQASIVQDPDQFPVKSQGRLSADDVRFLRRLETDLMYSYLITMSTQAGASNHIGRSHMVAKSYFEKRGLWHPDFSNLGLAGDDEKEAFRLYDTAEELVSGLDIWSNTMYQHNVTMPKNDFLDEAEIKEILGVKNLGYVVSGYGSASAFIDRGYKDAKALFYNLSQFQNLTTVDGGASRSVMLGFKEGALKARAEGYKVRNIGIRSETDVSPLEGNIKDWIRGRGFDISKGHDKRHFHFADQQMHVLRLSRLLQRQEPIAALSNISLFLPGGKGTVVEMCITKLHNALVRFHGEGLFSGYSSNNRTIPLVLVDHKFDNLGQQRGIFDKVISLDTDKRNFLDMHVFNGENAMSQTLAFVQAHAASSGMKLKRQMPSSSQEQGLSFEIG